MTRSPTLSQPVSALSHSMARQVPSPILAQIRDSRSPAEQIVALRALKNDIVGHQQKKEMWLGLGIVEPIVQLLTSYRGQGRSEKDQNDHTIAFESMSDAEKVRLQALCVIGSLAHGGPPFLMPLHSAFAVPAILSNLCPSNNAPKVVLAALRSLSNLADSVSLVADSHTVDAGTLADSLFSRPHVASLSRIASQLSPSTVIRSQIAEVTNLVGKLCRDERHRSSLANYGVLDALATRLASVVVSQGLVIPGADLVAQKEGLWEYFPSPAARNTDLAGVLEAIAVIIADSKFRASQLLYSNAIMAVFPASSLPDMRTNRSAKAAWSALNVSDLSTRQSRLSAIDHLIPHVPLGQAKNSSALASSFPPLGTPGSFEHANFDGPHPVDWTHSADLETDVSAQDDNKNGLQSHEPESPLIAYLFWLTRSAKDLERLMAASVLTVLHRARLTDKSREAALGLLVVPVLVQLLKETKISATSQTDGVVNGAEKISIDWKIRERASTVLAMLIVDSEYLQKSAFDAGITSKLSKMLKAAYDPIVDYPNSRAWSPKNEVGVDSDTAINPQASRLGLPGQSSVLAHKIRVRESTIRAIAALTPFKDEYRKAIIDQGVVPYIVESLKSNPGKPSNKSNENSDKCVQSTEENEMGSSGFGVNPISVLIAACAAVRHLSRSVSILRTTLIDNGVVMPVFSLLRHSEIDVQISATAAVCNLVMDFSPMRETITKAGVLTMLCEHAHSGNVKLRLNALWALKHLVQSAGNDVKKTCLEELGQGWLVQLICDDTEDEALTYSRSRIGVLEREGGIDGDHQIDSFEDDDGSRLADSNWALGGMNHSSDFMDSHGVSRPTSSCGRTTHQTNSRLAMLRDMETNPVRRARKDDIAVQEQGLDFIRNLIGGGTSETSEMIDFLLNTLGRDQIFDILASKLRSKATNPFNKRGSSSNNGGTRVLVPQAEIIVAVEYVLVHMAASVPRHRQLVISQTELLKLLVPQFNHPNKEVRLALCWLVINLTYIDNFDDLHDGQACAHRALELKRLGFLAKLETLEHDDCELDIRERAKVAVWQISRMSSKG